MTLTPTLSDFDWIVLQETRAVEGVTPEEVWRRVQYHKIPAFRSMIEPSLLRLNGLGLVRSLELEGDPLWLRTQQGDLVYNWRIQLDDPNPGPEPRPGETGNRRASPTPCDQYRPCYGAPAYCWCGWFSADHSAEAQQSKEAAP